MVTKISTSIEKKGFNEDELAMKRHNESEMLDGSTIILTLNFRDSDQVGTISITCDSKGSLSKVVPVISYLLNEISQHGKLLPPDDWETIVKMAGIWELYINTSPQTDESVTRVYCFGTEMEFGHPAEYSMRLLLEFLSLYNMSPSKVYTTAFETCVWEENDEWIGVVVVISNNIFDFTSTAREAAGLSNTFSVEDDNNGEVIRWDGFREQAYKLNNVYGKVI